MTLTYYTGPLGLIYNFLIFKQFDIIWLLGIAETE